jgi:hypothetical protein
LPKQQLDPNDMLAKRFHDFVIADRTFLPIDLFRIELLKKPFVFSGSKKFVAEFGELR